jgi:hypothetical protein
MWRLTRGHDRSLHPVRAPPKLARPAPDSSHEPHPGTEGEEHADGRERRNERAADATRQLRGEDSRIDDRQREHEPNRAWADRLGTSPHDNQHRDAKECPGKRRRSRHAICRERRGDLARPSVSGLEDAECLCDARGARIRATQLESMRQPDVPMCGHITVSHHLGRQPVHAKIGPLTADASRRARPHGPSRPPARRTRDGERAGSLAMWP